MESFNFNELPDVVRRLFEKVEQIELMVIKLQPREEGMNELLDIKEAAAFLKVSVASLYTRVSRKEIPVSKPGKKLYFHRSELQEWIKLSHKTRLSKIDDETQKRFLKRATHKLDRYGK